MSTDSHEQAPAAAGWRHAPGDRADTVRYWDGSTWWGDPVDRFDKESGRGHLVTTPNATRTPEPAPMLGRSIGTLVDAGLAGLLAWGAVLAGVLPEPVDPGSYAPAEYLDMLFNFTAWVIFAAFIWVVLDVTTTLISGRSFGKGVVGIVAVGVGSRDTAKRGATLRRALVKCVIMPVLCAVTYSSVLMLTAQQRPAIVAGALTVAVFAAVPYGSVRRRAAWDLAAGTEVVIID